MKLRAIHHRCYPLAMAFTLFGCNLADFAILWPPSDSAESKRHVEIVQQASIARRRVLLLADGKELEIWIARSAKPKPDAYVLRFYGNGARADWSIPSDASLFPNLEIWGVNYPGYGGSTGPATLRGVAASALAAYDVLASEVHNSGAPIFIAGSSLGTTAALHIGAERSSGVAGLVLENPPPLKKLVVGEYGWWNLWILASATASQIPEALDSEANARRCKMPALFISAEHDEIVPPEYQRRIIDAYAGNKEIIGVPNGTHNSGLTSETEQKVVDAVARMASAAAATTTSHANASRAQNIQNTNTQNTQNTQ